ICPKLHNQDFVEPPLEEEFVTFIQELGYSGKCDILSAIHTDQMHQPWRTFAAIINRCISRKTKRLDKLRESRAQILEISSARKEHMPYPRFTKVIINHFISKDKTISIRNMINLHTIRDDLLLDIKDSKAYKTYYDFATRKTTPKKARKYKKVASPSRKLSIVLEEEPAVKPKKANKPAKKSTTVPTTALLEVTQIKEALKKSKKDSHMLHPSGSGDGVGSQPKVPDESEDKKTCTDEGTGTKPGVHDVSKYQYESENESWGDSEDYDNVNDSDDVSKGDDDKADINEEEETQEDEYIHTPDYYVPTNEETNDENKEFDDEDYNQLYKDVNIRLKVAEHKEVSKGDAEMTDATHESASQEKSYKQVIEDAHVTLTSS
nr:hypothetical protein [Tanacetum cinerariifolium]